jgi:hypothetical protein
MAALADRALDLNPLRRGWHSSGVIRLRGGQPALPSRHMGRLEDARRVVAHLRTITPVVIPDARLLRNEEQREVFCQVCAWQPSRRHDQERPYASAR